jgi:hypothetical protein
MKGVSLLLMASFATGADGQTPVKPPIFHLPPPPLEQASSADKHSLSNEDWTKQLHEALKDATRLRVRSGGTCHRKPDEEKTLLDLDSPKEVTALIQQIQIDAEGGFPCMCCGNPTLEFFDKERLILSLGFHHGQSLRWLDGKWSTDGLQTKDSSALLIRWLSEHGVPVPEPTAKTKS